MSDAGDDFAIQPTWSDQHSDVRSDSTGKRVRTLNEKGMNVYIERREKYSQDIELLWSMLNALLEEVDNPPDSVRGCLALQEKIAQSASRYERQVDEFMKFMKDTRAEKSNRDLQAFTTLADIRQQTLNAAMSNLREATKAFGPASPAMHQPQGQHTINQQSNVELERPHGSVKQERSSVKSKPNSGCKSVSGSKSSSSSSVSRNKRAKADAAKAKIAFLAKQAAIAKQEALLEEHELQRKACQKAEYERAEAMAAATVIRKKMEFQADKTLLEAHMEAAMAEAEARAFADNDSQDVDDEPNVGVDLPLPTADPIRRVQDYVSQHNSSTHAMDENPADVGTNAYPTHTDNTRKVTVFEPPATTTTPRQLRPPSMASTPFRRETDDVDVTYNAYGLNRDAPVFVPSVQHRHTLPTMSVVTQENHFDKKDSTSDELTKFLLRKDLLLSRLTHFDDKAESYAVWKAEFKGVVDELGISNSEELILLKKWLGNKSSQYAKNIKESNVDNPTRGLKCLWERLDERYGALQLTEHALRQKLENFPKLTNKDTDRLYDLYDLVSHIQCLKRNPKFRDLLGYFDTSSGQLPIVAKLPFGLQEKWTTKASKYMRQHQVPFAPFSELSDFVREIAKIRNNPCFNYDSSSQPTTKPHSQAGKGKISAYKTSTDQRMDHGSADTSTDKPGKENSRPINLKERCIIHKGKHSLNECNGFRAKPIEERIKLLKEHSVCFKCCESDSHTKANCKERVVCKECESTRHPTALHIFNADQRQASFTRKSSQNNGGERTAPKTNTVNDTVQVTCTEVCGPIYSGKSCAKILPVDVFHKDDRSTVHRMYAIIDDQSSHTLATTEFFDFLNVKGPYWNFNLSTCSGRTLMSGRRANNLVVRSIENNFETDLPMIIECNDIPNNKSEIPTSEVALHHPHLRDIAHFIPPIDNNCEILLLIGRTLPAVHHILDQRLGSHFEPFAQKLPLGWVIIGETCLDRQHAPLDIDVKKTFILPNGRTSMMRPCPNQFHVTEYLDKVPCDQNDSGLNGLDIFEKTPDDDKPGLSQDDRQFVKQLEMEFKRNETGNWEAPLPFRSPRRPLPNNKEQATHRAKILDRSLKKNPEKRKHFQVFMAKILDNNHAEVAPQLHKGEECWYLPLFGVYHPKKPDQIRGVFDSSAKYNGVSLNDVLLTGPDLANSLLGVLLRFRREMVAVTADIQHMFHCFIVREDHRNYLRFLWYKDNDIEKELIEYRMRVYVFGNSPSPAVANLGLYKTAMEAEPNYGSDVVNFITSDFYVDDGLTSYPTAEGAIKIMKDTQDALLECGNLRLHKFASNSPEVMGAFSQNDLASNLKDLDLDAYNMPVQRSLGISWDLNTDQFLFNLSRDEKPVTRRGILSTINSIFDPIGFLAPVIIFGKLLLRRLVKITTDWDEPVSDEIASDWEKWQETLKALETVRIPRPYVPNLSEKPKKELHVFSDASKDAIGAVVYLRTIDSDGSPDLGFVIGKAKVAPTNGHTIPRLELCAAVVTSY